MTIRPDDYALPWRRNIVIAAVQLTLLLGMLVATAVVQGWLALVGLAVAYGVMMNSAYAMLHEAEHHLLHPNRVINDAVGAVLALFFPAPFHLLRQGHIGHHLRNRTDDEVFDLYLEGDNVVWKVVQFYGVLTGLFWVTVALSSVLGAVAPFMLKAKNATRMAVDRSTEAVYETLNQAYVALIWLESVLACGLHTGLMIGLGIPLGRYVIVLFGFGFMWSAMQYVHHYGTERDVRSGARNLQTWSWLDRMWLNHNWHLRHHQQPTVPWVYLPSLGDPQEDRGGLLAAYVTMWRGPKKTASHVENRYAGHIIR